MRADNTKIQAQDTQATPHRGSPVKSIFCNKEPSRLHGTPPGGPCAARMSAEATDKVVAELHAKGLCSEDGITSEEADNTFFDEIENLHTIGDGSWC